MPAEPTFTHSTVPPSLARLAGLGAFGACAGLVALFALLVFGTRSTALGGISPALAAVSWISLGLVFLALIGVHVLLGRELLRVSRLENRDP